MKKLPLSKAFTLLEPGPVVLITTHDGKRNNVMTISWTMVVGVGTCSGTDTDKFEKFKLTPHKASKVKAPLIQECLANIECQVIDNYKKHSVVFLQGVAAWVDAARKEPHMLHAVGDGTFIAGGRKLDRRQAMRFKLPAGV